MEEESTRFTDPQITNSTEERIEENLRPETFVEIIGRKREKENLQMMIDSAQKREAALDHVLFHGPPGLGKTSLAMVIAKEMGVPLHITSGPAITKAGDLASILTSLEERSILFIDEVHRIRHSVEEILYPAMEDSAIDIVIGKGPAAKTLRLELPKFTIIAATTKLSMLSSPLRDRFGAEFRLDFYSAEELKEIVIQKAGKMSIEIKDDAAGEIARRSRMTARIAVRILKRVRDLAVIEDAIHINLDRVETVLKMLEVDKHGLDETDRKLLHSLHYKFAGKPVGLGTLAASISEDPATVEDVYEPFLLRNGFLERTPKGRVLTQRAIDLILDNPNDLN